MRAFTIVSFAAPGHPGAVRGRGRRLRRHQRARQRRSTSSPTPSTCTLGHEGAAGDLLARHRRRRHRGHRLRLRADRLSEENDTMASDDIWILGIHMTKFGKHPDKDIVDLASEAALAALADGGVTMKDMGVLAAGNLMGAAAASASSCRSRSARPASPSTTWPTPAPPAPPRCAPRSWRSRPASATWASPSASRSSPAPACSARRSRARPTATPGTPKGRYGAVAPDRRSHRHRDDAGRVRPDRHGVRPQVRRHQLRAVRPDHARRTTPTRR